MTTEVKSGKQKPQRADCAGTRSQAFSFRLNAQERALLKVWAGDGSMTGYIKAKLFGSNRASLPRTPLSSVQLAHSRLLAQVLASLGQSGIATNLRDLADAARSGSLPVTPATEAQLRQACIDIAEIKALLMQALRIKER